MTVRFFPMQLPDGSTYVVDRVGNKVVRTITSDPDLGVRWHRAQTVALNLNRAEVLRAKRANRGGCLALFLAFPLILTVLDQVTGGGLSAALIRAISAAL